MLNPLIPQAKPSYRGRGETRRWLLGRYKSEEGTAPSLCYDGANALSRVLKEKFIPPIKVNLIV